MRQAKTGGVCHREDRSDGRKFPISTIEMFIGFHGILLSRGHTKAFCMAEKRSIFPFLM